MVLGFPRRSKGTVAAANLSAQITETAATSTRGVVAMVPPLVFALVCRRRITADGVKG